MVPSDRVAMDTPKTLKSLYTHNEYW